jgi:hypothetical protein
MFLIEGILHVHLICYHFPIQVQPKEYINFTSFVNFITFVRNCSEFGIHLCSQCLAMCTLVHGLGVLMGVL